MSGDGGSMRGPPSPFSHIYMEVCVMKYLDALKQSGKDSKKSIIDPENKMQPGSRPGQRNNLDRSDPQSLVSSPSGRGTKTPEDNVSKLAKDLDVDLSTVTGTGPNGATTEKDVRHAKK